MRIPKLKNSNKTYLIGITFSLLLSSILLSDTLKARGIITYRDILWTSDLDSFKHRFISTWNENLNSNALDDIKRMPIWELPLTISLRLGFNSETLEKSMFFFLFSFSIFSALYVAYQLFGRFSLTQNTRLLASSIVSFVFVINPFFLHWIIAFEFIFGYALLPWILLFFVRGMETSSIKYPLLSGVAYALAVGGMVHYLYFIPLLWLLLSLTFFLTTKKPKKTVLISLFKFAFIVSCSFLLLSSFWLLPAIITLERSGVSPPYTFTSETLAMLSDPSKLVNSMRLLGYWWPPLNFTPPSFLNSEVWTALTFFLPILAFSTFLLIRKNKLSLFFGVLALLSVSLGSGINQPLGAVYAKIVTIPFGWIFRVPQKWFVFEAFAYSFLVGFLIISIFTTKNIKSYLKYVLSLVVVFLIGVTYWQMFTGNVGGTLASTLVPPALNEANIWLGAQKGEFKVLWLPYDFEKILWGEKVPQEFYLVSSLKPTYNLRAYPMSSYFKAVSEDGLSPNSTLFCKMLVPLGIKYIVYHNDTLPQTETLNLLKSQSCLELVKKTDFVYIFETKEVSNLFTAASDIYLVEGPLTRLTTISKNKPSLGVSQIMDQTPALQIQKTKVINHIFVLTNSLTALYLAPNFESHKISLLEETTHHAPEMTWSKGGTADPLHAPWHIYLSAFSIDNWGMDYGLGLVFTWAPTKLKESKASTNTGLVYRVDFAEGTSSFNSSSSLLTINQGDRSFSGTFGLRAKILNGSSWGWKVVESEPVPVQDSNYYKISMQVSGKDVKGVHSKIVYFDKNDSAIRTDFIFGGTDGTFDWKKFENTFLTPSGTKYAKIQFWVWQNNQTDSYYWVDDIRIYDLRNYTEPNSLEMDAKVDKEGNYDLFARYFQNEKGGRIKVALNGNEIGVNTQSQLNAFVWKNLGNFNLTKGKHKLVLENIEGFNAVNLFVIVPHEEFLRLEKETKELLKNKRVMYVFEAESDMYRENAAKSKRFGAEASNGEGLDFLPASRAWQEFEVAKPGNYRIALRLNGNFEVAVDETRFNASTNNLNFTYLEPVYFGEGLHKISVTSKTVLEPKLWNFTSIQDLYDWREYSSGNVQKLLFENDTLKAELYNSTWGWKTVSSPLIPVFTGSKYTWTFKIKGENAESVHLKVAEFDSNKKLISGRYVQDIGSGTFGWKEVRAEVEPTNSSTAYMQIQVWHGHETKKPLPNKLWVANVSTYGYKLNFLDVVWVYSTDKENETLDDVFTVNETPATVLNYTKIDPTKWVMQVNASKPFMLSFAEAYDPLWVVYVDSINGKKVSSEKIRPVPLYSVINGFWIDQTGMLDITIEYEPQRWFYYGAAVSIVSLIGSIFLVWRERKNEKKAKNKGKR